MSAVWASASDVPAKSRNKSRSMARKCLGFEATEAW